MRKIEVDKAWDITKGDPNIKIAVIDLGFWTGGYRPPLNSDKDYVYCCGVAHPDLRGKINQRDPIDTNFYLSKYCCDQWEIHGTAVAGIAAGITDGGGGYSSVGFNSGLIAYHDRNNAYQVVKSALHASNIMGAKVINYSMTGFSPHQNFDYVKEAVKQILDNGTVIVRSAGNINTDSDYNRYPFSIEVDDRIIIVGSTDFSDKHANPDPLYSNDVSSYPEISVCAPWYCITTLTRPTLDSHSEYYQYSNYGTSFASPMVAGVCALIKSIVPDLPAATVKEIIQNTSDPITDAHLFPGTCGTGRVNAHKAVCEALKYLPEQHISSKMVWDRSKTISTNILITPAGELTIDSTVQMVAGSSITIIPGGKLIIDGGTVTSVNDCDGEMWQGIYIMGMYGQYKGSVEIKNGGKIENAVCGITARTGAIVNVNNASFVNNITGVKFEEVIATDSGITGSFTNTNFIIDNNYLGDSNSFQSHLNIQGGATVTISDCSFSLPQNFYNKNSIIVKNASTNWTNSNYLNRSNSILLQEDGKLTHTGTIFCAENVGITVLLGGELIVDGGKLVNLIHGIFWQGITVHGADEAETPNEPDASKAEIAKGLVQILNGGTIENAIIGINAKAGGKVDAQNASFLNNKTGVWFKPLLISQSGSSGTFKNTSFKLDDNFMGNQGDFNAHLIMDNCGTVGISSCHFTNSSSQNIFSNGIIVKNSITNWSNNSTLRDVPLFLTDGATMTLTGKISNKDIYTWGIQVFSPSKLIVDGGVLTNFSTSIILPDTNYSKLPKDEMWKGVTVYGSSLPNNTEMIQLTNGGTIENALCGITVNDYGIVTANNAHFLNNTMGVKFNPVQNNSTFTSGTFNDTNFELNSKYLDIDPFDVHLFMENSGSVNINNSVFSSTVIKNTTKANRGIVAQNSNLIIGDIFGIGAGTNCQFTGFNTAVSATTKEDAPIFKVYNGVFDNNLLGIEVLGIDNIEITNNEFLISEVEGVGVSITDATGYKIEENDFTYETGLVIEPPPLNNAIGLHINDSGTDENKVYLNSFYGLSIGQLFSGINADKDTGIGLQSLCNSFRGNSGRIHDIYIGKYPVNNPGDVHLIATDQGNADVPAGNTFDATNSFIINISNNSAPATMINYYHGPGNLEFPSFNNNVNPILVPESAKCGSKSREEEDEVSGMRYEVRGMRYEVSGEDEVSGVRDEVSGENLRESVSSVSSACKENDIILIPNPTTGVLQVTSYELQVTGIEVFDIYGKNLTPHTSYLAPQTSLDISNLASGVYFVKIYTNAGVVTKKVIKN